MPRKSITVTTNQCTTKWTEMWDGEIFHGLQTGGSTPISTHVLKMEVRSSCWAGTNQSNFRKQWNYENKTSPGSTPPPISLLYHRRLPPLHVSWRCSRRRARKLLSKILKNHQIVRKSTSDSLPSSGFRFRHRADIYFPIFLSLTF